MFLGTIDNWYPEGNVVSWHPTLKSRELESSALVSDVRVSHQQSQHLRHYRAQTAQGRDIPRLCIGVWDIPGECDIAAMTHAINTHIRRHDTYHSFYEFDDGDEIQRFTISDPSDIELAPVDYGFLGPPEIRKLLMNTPHPLVWDCFTFGIIQQTHNFTFYAAVDHLLADGISAGVLFVDIQMTYPSALSGQPVELPRAGSYRDYCAKQRDYTDTLTHDSAKVQAWHEFALANGGTLPSYPLPLGDPRVHTVGAIDVIPLLDEEQGKKFDAACRAAGARFSGGVFACAALTENELTGADTYFGLTPFDNRKTAAECMSIGWFATFIPLTIRTADLSIEEVILLAQQSFDEGRRLGDVPIYHVLDMPAPETGPINLPDLPVPMLSFMDIRRIPFSEHMDGLNVGIWGDNRMSNGVCMWVNRWHTRTELVISYPDNPVADESVHRYADIMGSKFLELAEYGAEECEPAVVEAIA